MSGYIYQLSDESVKTLLKSYILRDAAIDEIYHHFPSLSRSEAAMVLHTVPSVDVVEVVRCCDCKYFRNNTEFGYPWCDRRRNADLFVSGLDYCSYAERRTDGDIY